MDPQLIDRGSSEAARSSIEGARRIVAERVAEWPDEKLIRVRLFCASGAMDVTNPCCCIIGVDSWPELHTDRRVCDGGLHYDATLRREGRALEIAYYALGFIGYTRDNRTLQQNRDRQLLEIIDAEIDRRTSSILASQIATSEQEVIQKIDSLESLQTRWLRSLAGGRTDSSNRGDSLRLNDDEEESEPPPFPDYVETRR